MMDPPTKQQRACLTWYTTTMCQSKARLWTHRRLTRCCSRATLHRNHQSNYPQAYPSPRPPAWASAADLGSQQYSPPWQQVQSTASLPTQISAGDYYEGDDFIAHSMNQGAAFCDRVAARLNDVLGRLDSEDAHEEDIDALIEGLTIEDNQPRAVPADRASQNRRRKAQRKEQPKSGIINFRKTWLYANSRLPPQMVPFKIYLPTWQILCRAADVSRAVYVRPRESNEKEEYIDADWRNGTKAMALKSFCIDEKNLIVFAVRGSKWNLVDWAVNFRPAPRQPTGFLDDGGNACHAGFLQVAKAMIRPVAARLRQLLEQDPSRATSSLLLTGHSAGGAVASLLYMHMLSTAVESELNILTGCFKRVHCVTFGAPPVSLLPLQKPNDERNKKNVFIGFANEGDPVVRADKQYIYSLGRLISAPAPTKSLAAPSHGLKAKISRQNFKAHSGSSSSMQPPRWPVPDATLSNAGRLVLLRTKPGRKRDTEAVCVSDDQLRGVIFGDPAMHEMALYKRRIDELAIAAITGRENV